MTERFASLLNDVMAFLLLPATIYGAGGAFMQSARKGKTVKQTLFEVVGGVIITSALSPLVVTYCPTETHPGLYFLVGWGGLKFVDRMYLAVVAALERRIQRKIGDE
jgi:hypothetical protein